MPTYATNKRALYDYDILEKIEAGLVLTGGEVKSIRAGAVRLAGSYVIFHGDSAFVINLHISKYAMAGASMPHDPERSKKLLLKAKEIDRLRGKSQEQGLTIIPLSLYARGPRIKVEIAVARGKKKYDKREAIKKKDMKRELRRGR